MKDLRILILVFALFAFYNANSQIIPPKPVKPIKCGIYNFNNQGSTTSLSPKSICGGETFRLINNNLSSPQSSAVWCNNSFLDLNIPFKAHFYIRFGRDAASNNADGLVFILHQSTTPTVGLPGGGLGYQNSNLGPSFGVEFDIYDNGIYFGDDIGGHLIKDHSTIVENGNLSNPLTSPPLINLGNIEDGIAYPIEMDWDPCTTELCIKFNNQKKYCVSKDLVMDVFNGQGTNVRWGFTASCGASSSNIDVCFCLMDIGIRCDDNTQFCCEEKNYIMNGNFEAGDSDFTSEYNAANLNTSMVPENYTVSSYSLVPDICNSLEINDHTRCINGTNSRFLVVNGQTQQIANTNNAIWQSTAYQLQVNNDYTFCAFFQNIPQCCFDIYPQIKIQYKDQNGTWVNLTYNPNWITININTSPATSDSCNWLPYTGSFTAINSIMEFRIIINEIQNGDGNDLAIDDISLTETIIGCP